MRLVRRKPKNPDACGKLELERIIGLTTGTAAGLACNGVSEQLAYLAGCVVVVYNVRSNCQTQFLMAPRSPKPLSCVAFSAQGGKFIAAGESGHQPAIVVWEVATGTCIADMKTHKYGVSSVQFSPNGKHLVSLGMAHDGYICLWDWKSGTLLMKTRAAAAFVSASALQFATDGSFFVSGGAKHLKQWTIGGPRARSSGMNANPGMDGVPIKLGSQKDSTFVCVSSAAVAKEQVAGAPSYQPIYALTSAGVLCLLHSGSAIEKWVDLQVRQAYALAISEAHIACACSDGIVRIFLQGSLEYSSTLPRPAPYGYHGLTDPNVGAYLAVGHRVTSGIKFPDAVACTFLQQGQLLAVIYSDHSLYVWDVRSYSKIGRYRTFLSHSSCIWDLTIIPEPFQSMNEDSAFSGGAFATCSADGTIRLWHLDLGQEDTSQGSTVPSWPQNVYSKDILGVLYIDNMGEQKGRLSTAGPNEELADTSVGFRSICVSPGGNHLAAGDSSGNLRIYDLSTLLLHSFQEAHDAEILSLNYTTVINVENNLPDTHSLTIPLLASGGRDRLIHIYDVNRGYDVIETLDDHTASITTVKFACNGSKLLSCSADKSVVFRNVAVTTAGCKSTRYHQEIATRGTIYDMDTDASDKFAVTVGQEKKLNILSLYTGKPVRCFKPEGDVGEPIKVRMDPSGMYMVCSHLDRCMRVYNFMTGELLAQASGHAEVITGVNFLPDCRRLISVSGDSCIFVWRLPLLLSRAMRRRCSTIAESRPPLKSLKSAAPRSTVPKISRAAKMPRVHQLKPGEGMDETSNFLASGETDENVCPIEHDKNTVGKTGWEIQETDAETPCREAGEVEEETPAAFKFSVSRLPPWAQAKISLEEANSSGGKGEPTEQGKANQSFESRWAERLGREGYKLFSEFMEEVTPPATIRASGFGARRRFSVEGGGPSNSDITPESGTSQLRTSPMSSPREAPRKETHWTSVHTVLLNDSDFDDTPKVAPLDDSSSQMPVSLAEKIRPKSPLGVEGEDHEGEDADHVEVGLSDDEGSDRAAGGVEEIVYYTPGSAPAGVKSKDGEDVVFKVSSKNKSELMEDAQSVPCSPLNTTKRAEDHDGDGKHLSWLDSDKLSVESEDEEVAEDDEFSPRRDLFSAHFDKLASDLKVGGSARRSFSARFFALSNTKLSRSTLFQSSPAGGRAKLSKDTQVLLEDDDDPEKTPGQLLAAERERLKLQDQQERHTSEVQRMQERLVNMGIKSSLTDSTTPQRSKAKDIVEKNLGSLPGTGSPQTPDLLPSRSPQLTQERKGHHPSRFHNDSSMPFTFSAKKNAPASPALPSSFQDTDTDRNSTGICGRSCCGEVQMPDTDGVIEADASLAAVKVCEAPVDSRPSSTEQLPTASEALEAESSTETEHIPAGDDAAKQGSLPLGARITEHEVDCETENEEGHERKDSVSGTGEIDEPLLSSWEPTPGARTAQTLPRPVEDYQKALKELLDAANKASTLFSEVHSFCQRKTAKPADLSPSTLPPDAVCAGQAYQKLVPESLQLIQKLAYKVSLCVLPLDLAEAAKPADDDCGALSDFSFQKGDDDGDNNSLQGWPRTSAASLDSLLSSVDVESFISRYSETLASQVLALVQKSLPPPPA